MKDDQLIFLVSQPRSGSTLLQKILGAHEQIYTRSEPWLMLYPLYAFKKTGIYTEYNQELGRQGCDDFCQGLDGGREKYWNSLREMYLGLYGRYLEKSSQQYFLDKTPRYYFILNELKEVFPNAKTILLIRNPLAVLSSIIKTWVDDDWETLASFRHDLFDAIDKYIEIIDKKNSNLLIVHYEDLLRNKRAEMEKIFNFLGIAFSENIFNYHQTSERWYFGDQKNVYLKKGVDEKNGEKWQEDLSDPQHWSCLNEYLFLIGKEKFEKIGYDFEKYKKILESKMPSEKNCLKKEIFSLKVLLERESSNKKNNAEEVLRRDFNRVSEAYLEKRRELEKIYCSLEWRIALKFQRVFKITFPRKKWRKWLLAKIFFARNAFFRGLFWLRIFSFEFFCAGKIFLLSFLPRKKRRINLKSKKLVYVGHSYHARTKSTEFLIEYLKKFFDVKVILDKSWQGKPPVDLTFIDEKYLGVVFFQLLPPEDVLKKIKNDNIIYFPMYDQSRLKRPSFWLNCRRFKVINFSKRLHRKLKIWGLDSIYIQYFPPVGEFFQGEKGDVFFWQRLNKINFNTIKKLFNNMAARIHLHKAVDPDQKFIQPTKEDEEKFQISYSDWFETREEMLGVIKSKAIYVAPREYEGIGMSFLEAMAMGKAVVAVDNPTMNEYIEHNKNGYLFNLKNPKALNFDKLETVQRNAYFFMKKGREKWEKEKSKIIDFIKKS